MTSHEVLERTRHYVQEQFLYARPDFHLSEEEPLFENGIVDSMGVVELMQFLETEYGIAIEDDEVTEQHFCNLRSIADYVCTKRAADVVT
jgi:acyl carrier protein